MITEFLLSLGADVVEWIVSLFPTIEVWPWFADLGNTVNGFLGQLAGTGGWIEWTVLGACIVAVLGAWALFGGIKLIRAAAGHIPAVGGNG